MTDQRSRWVPQPFGPGWLREWLKRHQHPISFVLHLVGIPMTICALLPLLFDITSFTMWCYAAVLFLVGYGLQFLGHAIEGNDAGETILVKKWLGKPYVAVAPRWEDTPAATSPTTHS
ncbi:MAG: DUF962 domain-containing protein [Gemmatales bacterium]